jgi:hypothetical protein
MTQNIENAFFYTKSGMVDIDCLDEELKDEKQEVRH